MGLLAPAKTKTGRPRPEGRGWQETVEAYVPIAPSLFGIGGGLAACDEVELARLTEPISTYKVVRHVVRHGVPHRLGEPGSDALTGVRYTARDGAKPGFWPTGTPAASAGSIRSCRCAPPSAGPLPKPRNRPRAPVPCCSPGRTSRPTRRRGGSGPAKSKTQY